MQPQPAETLQEIREDMARKCDAGQLYEMDMQRFLRKAEKISSTLPARDAAEGHVMAQWHRFDEAEGYARRLVHKWGASTFTHEQASTIYAMALRYDEALASAQAVTSLAPQSVEAWRLVEHMALLAGAFQSAKLALEKLEQLGVSKAELNHGAVENEVMLQNQFNITDSQLIEYHQAHVNVARKYINRNPAIATRVRRSYTGQSEMDDQELIIELSMNIDGKTAAKIEWEMAGLDLEPFPEVLRDKIMIGVHPFQLDSMKKAEST